LDTDDFVLTNKFLFCRNCSTEKREELNEYVCSKWKFPTCFLRMRTKMAEKRSDKDLKDLALRYVSYEQFREIESSLICVIKTGN